MQNNNEINIINLRSGHLKRKLTNGDVESEDGSKDKEEDNKHKEKEKEESVVSKKCKKSKKKKRKKSKKGSKKKDRGLKDKLDEKENRKSNNDGVGGAAANCDETSAKINPIFLWVEQKDSKIISVLCEDYDKRNRIRLSKVFDGRWTAVPRTDRLVEAIEITKNKISSDSSSENLVTKNNKCISRTKDNLEKDSSFLEENQVSCTCQGNPCSCHSNEDEEIVKELSPAKQKKQKVFLDESQNLINIVNNLMELLDGIKENSIKEKEEARMKRRNQDLMGENSEEHCSKRRRRDESEDVDKTYMKDDASLKNNENSLETCDNEAIVESDIVNSSEVTQNVEECFSSESKSVDESNIGSTTSEEFKENKNIQYNIINKHQNSHVNKINIKLSYAKKNTKIYDKNENSRSTRSASTDVYDFENEDQFEEISLHPKSDISSRRLSSESSTKTIQTDETQSEKNEDKSSEEKLSILEKLAKEKPLTNSFEASFRKFIIENEAPCSSATQNSKNEKFELDIRLSDTKISKQSSIESSVKPNVLGKSEVRTLNIKTVHEINNSTLAMNKENNNRVDIEDETFSENVLTDNINIEHQTCAEKSEETKAEDNKLVPIPTTLDSASPNIDEIPKRIYHAGKEIKKDSRHVPSHKGIVHRGKTISLEEFENEFVANYDEMITEDETSDDDSSSYHSGQGAHGGARFDMNPWNDNQSFDHNLNVIEDQHQLQAMKDKRLFDLYNRNKISNTNMNTFDHMNSLQQKDRECNLDISRKSVRPDHEADDSSFFESIANINKQQLMHGTVFLPDEEFIDLEKIQPEKLLSEDLNQDHIHSICHSSKDLWDVETNSMAIKLQEMESNVNTRDKNTIECDKTVPDDSIQETKPAPENNDKDMVVPSNLDAHTEPEIKENCEVLTIEENKNTDTKSPHVKKTEPASVTNTDSKKPIGKMKTKDKKLDSIINKIITNKNKEEKEHQQSESGHTIPIPEVKREISEVSEEIIQQINKSPILTLEIDGYEIVDPIETADKHILDQNKDGQEKEINSSVVNNVEEKKNIDSNKPTKLMNSFSISSMVGNAMSWNHSEHSVDSITNDILNEFCDSNHSDFTNCNKIKHVTTEVSNNRNINSWMECSNNSSGPINFKAPDSKPKENEPDKDNDVDGGESSCGKLHNTLKLPKETTIYPIPENQEELVNENTKKPSTENVNELEIRLDDVKKCNDSLNNDENKDGATIDLSLKNNSDAKDAKENKSNVGIIKIRKSSELFMNSEQTEPLDLGSHTNEKFAIAPNEEKNKTENYKEEITIKSLLTKNIKTLTSDETVTKSEKSKLLELLTTDSEDILLNQLNESMIHTLENVSINKIKSARENIKLNELHSELPKPASRSIENTEPIEQLKAILSNPNIIVPDPLLVPRSRLPALVTSPAREIPKLMSNIIDYNKMNNELLVISLNNLHKLIQTTDKDDEKLIYNQQLNYLKEQYSKINKTSNTTTDQNLLSYLDSNNNNKDLLNNMFMGYNELLNPFIQANVEATIPGNQKAHNNVDNIMNMLMYKQYNEMYSNKMMKQNQMKDMAMQSKEKDAYLKELYTFIQNTYPQYSPKEIFNTMQVLQKDMMPATKDMSKNKFNTNHGSSNNTVRELLANHHNKNSYNNYQQSQKDAKLYQQNMHKRESSNAYQQSQEYINAMKKKQSNYPTSQSHHKKPVDKMSKFNEMFALSQQHKPVPHAMNPYEKYYLQHQQHQQQYNPLLAPNLNQQPTYFGQPDLSLLSPYGNMGANMMGMNSVLSNEEQLKKIQEEYLAFQQQLQLQQQQTYLNYQHQQHERNATIKTPPRSSPHSSSPGRHTKHSQPSKNPSEPSRSGSSEPKHSSSNEHAFYNATRNELKHNYDFSRKEKPRDATKSESGREFSDSLYGGATVNELRNCYNNARETNTTAAHGNGTKPGTPGESGNPSTPKLKVKSNIIDTTSKPKLLKHADPEQVPAPAPYHPFPGMNPLLPHPLAPGLEPHHTMEDVHPYLWHPLFGKYVSYYYYFTFFLHFSFYFSIHFSFYIC